MVIRKPNTPEHPYDVELNVFADLDDFDVTFTVSACVADTAERALNDAFDNWHNTDPAETLYEALENALIARGIPFESSLDDEN